MMTLAGLDTSRWTKTKQSVPVSVRVCVARVSEHRVAVCDTHDKTRSNGLSNVKEGRAEALQVSGWIRKLDGPPALFHSIHYL